METWSVEIETQEVTRPDVAVSPDGEWLIFTALGHLFRLPVEGGAAQQLTFGPYFDSDPAISPDGRYVVFATITDANKSVAVSPIGGAADYVDWLQQILSALGVTQARVAGLSYGGWLAALLALHAPERVSHLLLLCPAATLAPLPVQFFARMLPAGLLRSRFLARRAVQWMSTTPDAMSDPVVELIAENFVACRPMRREIWPTVLTDDELRRLSGLRPPEWCTSRTR